MALNISQQGRLGILHTPLGPDKLGLLRFDGTDAINDLFEYRIEAISDDPDIDFDALIGHHISVELTHVYKDKKWYDGILADGQYVGVGETGNIYRLVLRPWIWLGSRRRNQRIFHEKTAPEIIAEVLGEYGSGPFEDRLTRTYPVLEYTVQYRESDLTFVSRIMEKYGINYYFAHGEGEHVMALVDSHDNFEAILGSSRPYYGTVSGAHSSDEEHFWAWSPKRNLTTGKIVMTGYNFKTPTANMRVEQTGDAAYQNGQIESFDYPGTYLDEGQGKDVARLRTEQERSADKRHSASGNIITLCSGMRMTATGHLKDDLVDREYLCARAHHSFRSEAYGSGSTGGQKEVYVGHYEFVTTEVPFAPIRKTEETRVHGPQTAWVVGADGEEIDCDEYGRILVRFHWDLAGAHSMRCRVAQMWAGNKWGSMYIPRIGMEVVVDFIEGDPDQPLVVGCVYNADNMPPYDLPGEKNLGGIKSDSTVGGGGYNELVFDDTKGEELFRQHAQLDMSTKVLQNETREVDNDRDTVIGHDETRTVKNDEAHHIEKNSTYLIDGGEKRTIGGNHDTQIKGAETHKVTKNRTSDVMGAEKLTVTKTTDINGLQAITIESMQSIELKVGMNKIKIDQSGVKIEGLQVDVKALTTLNTEGLLSTHKASALMTVQGALVKIN
ncbi:type VI secretion system Vgr family protein [Actibacterium sp. 188UL27-1]|uniref:type VI secretion system Vgr family protein n=1 Tax=Actibacterium sp. 188UL27-1 TaxID=2786961 RepID=UPI0019591F6B|nr:type VI secretion system tip protein TssI/VgrG [Actibacterium sp. 188UL27-1]MBM7068834.1 type VI secretion system tip protein VgrG [Actibacterium sp. 188UL27-1]